MILVIASLNLLPLFSTQNNVMWDLIHETTLESILLTWASIL